MRDKVSQAVRNLPQDLTAPPVVSKADADMVLLPISATGLKGRGFGLALTNQYVQMIGGKIDPPIPGRGGVGAKFLVHLKVN